MIGYSILDDTQPPAPIQQKPVVRQRDTKSFGFFKIRTECDMVVLGFVLATLLLLLSDMFPVIRN